MGREEREEQDKDKGAVVSIDCSHHPTNTSRVREVVDVEQPSTTMNASVSLSGGHHTLEPSNLEVLFLSPSSSVTSSLFVFLLFPSSPPF